MATPLSVLLADTQARARARDTQGWAAKVQLVLDSCHPKQRSFGDWVALTIMRMQGACAGIQGVRIPPGPPDVNGGQPKDALIKKLQVVASSCEQTFKDLSDRDVLTANEVVAGPPINVMLAFLTDISNSTGNLAGYLRAKGITTQSLSRETAAK